MRDGLAAFARGDVERVRELVHPDVIAVRTAPLPDPEVYQGIEGIYQMYADWTADLDAFEMDTGEVTDVGERVVAEITQSGKGKISGAPVQGSFWFVFSFRDGKVSRQDVFQTRQQAFEWAVKDSNLQP